MRRALDTNYDFAAENKCRVLMVNKYGVYRFDTFGGNVSNYNCQPGKYM